MNIRIQYLDMHPNLKVHPIHKHTYMHTRMHGYIYIHASDLGDHGRCWRRQNGSREGTRRGQGRCHPGVIPKKCTVNEQYTYIYMYRVRLGLTLYICICVYIYFLLYTPGAYVYRSNKYTVPCLRVSGSCKDGSREGTRGGQG